MIDQFKMMDLHSYAGLESLEGLEGPYMMLSMGILEYSNSWMVDNGKSKHKMDDTLWVN